MDSKNKAICKCSECGKGDKNEVASAYSGQFFSGQSPDSAGVRFKSATITIGDMEKATMLELSNFTQKELETLTKDEFYKRLDEIKSKASSVPESD